ncbi:hypothetical protein C8Q76DRAFT_773823 [Earliella scabrosa]|nr:hypothetical protein C8Q76DRAFT_773823 [Earliella scabrosa]
MSAAVATMSASHAMLPPLAIPTKSRSQSRSDAIAMYPTSPLGVFPPPAPPARRSLRDRCGVSLTLEIDAPFKTGKMPGPWSPKGHLQPHRSNLPRRRANPAKPRFANFQDVKTPIFETPKPKAAEPTPAPAPAPLPTPLQPPKANDPHLQAIIPSVYVAFGQDTDRSYEEGFTHIVDICYASGVAFTGGSAERRWEGRVQRLRLVLPETARKWEGRAALELSGPQLRAARDFIAEGLPQSLAALPDQDTVRVLVTAPAGRPTDAMCVLGCYLAFVAGRDAESILRCIDEEESILSVWKGEVSGDEIERIEKIARAWSWLSAVAPGHAS